MANRFSKLVKENRQRMGLTQEQLAEAMEITHPAVVHWEQRGIGHLSPAKVRRLAATLDVSPLLILESFGFPVGEGKAATPLDQAGLPPLKGEDLDKVIEYAWMLYERAGKRTQPPIRKRARGGSTAA